MAICSTGDSFQVDALIDYDGVSLDGCYDDTGGTSSSVILYSLDGVVYRNTVYAPNLPIAFAYKEISSEHSVWFLGYQLQDYGTGNVRRCRDADQEDANTLHPADVRRWDCYNETASVSYAPGEFVLEGYVTITCGCNTPEPTLAPSPSPEPEPTSPCSDGDSFLLDTLATQDGRSLNGCFEDAGNSFLGVTAYYAGTIEEPQGESPFVYAAELFPNFPVWVLGIQRYDDYYDFTEIITCVDAGYQNASTIHPTEVGRWDCFNSYDGTLANPVTTRCGCSTPEPAPAIHILESLPDAPPPTPGSVPVTAQTSDHNDSSDGDKGVSVGVIVGSAVGGALVVCILVVVILFKTGRLKTGTRVTSVSPDAA